MLIKKLSDFNLIDEISKIHQQLNIGNDSTQNIRNNLVTLEKIFDLLFSSKIKSENLNTDIQNQEFCKINEQVDSKNNENQNFDNEDCLKSSDSIGAVTLENIENGFTFLSLIGDELRKDANEVVEILKQ
ncbi:hypothetical protein BpHYR1_016296 [Brachionus plicatilis]|uniref:Uncharacterized protein n=1 Tax=Brachionus plicatilis TaxID=10195 RepID=A0A3M7QLX2_BRAPC|nr:hypothetical protein BpHYR1_016296 [Brachionus plicatilis]